MSGGQKQRLTIARALLRKPKVLILDDSTSAVDTATDAKIRKAFREEIPGTTKIIIAQRISSVQDADRILVLDNGQINGLGTHEAVSYTHLPVIAVSIINDLFIIFSKDSLFRAPCPGYATLGKHISRHTQSTYQRCV